VGSEFVGACSAREVARVRARTRARDSSNDKFAAMLKITRAGPDIGRADIYYLTFINYRCVGTAPRLSLASPSPVLFLSSLRQFRIMAVV